ncbi:GPW/gp25 family protein [Pseudonocardia charpentierae]|uniref:GPW/gp25 family protein n=1 Tax=Pseudonocardia charpentierae TaxID=3075545 RepID=A0ABU2NGN9_9PSEU|nr:GPW/gp25 family protein [Pseudonocardia sp. DSM 45834]MDT0353135.1 GPW/gp25 family protein [Pseudonocardia sp. DSM 45834]
MLGDFYGRGAAHPLTLTPIGGVAEAAGVALVEQSIRMILRTQHGERVMRPDFGANLRSLAFSANTPATANLARHLVESALARWEPRIEVLDVDVRNVVADATLLVVVTYRLVGTADVRSLLQPVPLEGPS